MWWPGKTFRQWNEYGGISSVDVPNCPRELNYYEKFLVRLAFADLKVLIILAVGVIFGILNWIFLEFLHMWFI